MNLKAVLNRIKYFISEGSWVVIGQIVSAAGALVLVRLLTQNLNPSGYGQLALALTISALVNQVIIGGICNGIPRFFTIAEKNQELEIYYKATRNLMVYSGLAILVISIPIISYFLICGDLGWMKLSGFILLYSLLNGYNLILINIQNAARKRRPASIFIILDAWVKIIIVLTLIFFTYSTATVVAIGFSISSFIILICQIKFMKKNLAQKKIKLDSEKWVKKIWKYSLPFCYWGTFSWLQQSSDRWALQIFSDQSDVGKFAVLYQLGFMPTSMLSAMAISFIGPIFYQKVGDARNSEENYRVHLSAWKMTFAIILLTLMASIASCFFNNKIFQLFTSKEYNEASYLLPWIIVAGGVFAAGQILTLKLMSELKTAEMTFAKIITSTLGILFNILGAAIAGLEGVITALIAFSVIYIIWIGKLSYKSLPQKV